MAPVPMMPTFLPASSTGAASKRVERAALERLHAFQPRQRRYRQQPDRQNDEPAGQFASVVEPEPPQMTGFVERRRLYLKIEPHVFAQIELVGDVVEVAEAPAAPKTAPSSATR